MSKELTSLQPTTMAILGKLPKRELVKAMSRLDKNIVLHDNTIPSISKLCRFYSDEKIETIVAMMLQDTSAFVGEAMNKNQAIDTAVEILNTYPYRSLKLEEIYIICSEIKQSENYGKLTPNKMMVAIKKFWEDREQRAIKNSMDTSQINKQETNLDNRIKKTVRLKEHTNNAIDRTRNLNNKYYK